MRPSVTFSLATEILGVLLVVDDELGSVWAGAEFEAPGLGPGAGWPDVAAAPDAFFCACVLAGVCPEGAAEGVVFEDAEFFCPILEKFHSWPLADFTRLISGWFSVRCVMFRLFEKIKGSNS